MNADHLLDLLLVEDDDIDREYVRRLLQADYRVHEASTGKAALELVAATRPACVLLDYHLPDIGGLELLSLLAAQSIPVIILTGEESAEVIVEAMQRGALHYLVKSHISHMALLHAINSALEKSALKRDIEEKSKQLALFASELTLTEQRERRRISHILHDHVQQMLYGMQMRIHVMGLDALDQTAFASHLAEMEKLLSQATRAIRTLTVELSPPLLHNEGLGAAFQWLAKHMAETQSLQVRCEIESDYQAPSLDLGVLIFQLVRELLFNVVKHAGVFQASLQLVEREGNLEITISDQGQGFNVTNLAKRSDSQGGFGLYSISERLALFGGRLEINSVLGQGVSAKIIVPCEISPYLLSAKSSLNIYENGYQELPKPERLVARW